MSPATAQDEPSFTLGGAVSPHGFYVERAADLAIQKQLSALQSCYVAQPRQIGKSSLRKHTAAVLRGRGFAVVELDLTNMSSVPLPRLWERVETLLAGELERLGRAPRPWLAGAPDAPERSFSAYVADEVLPLLDAGLVVFVDEVNVLGTRGDAAIILAELKALIERRERCAVCLTGVCPPSDLVTEPTADPTPLMRAIPIEDFSAKEVASFAPLLAGVADPGPILTAAFEVTSGHPYMVQNLLAMVVDAVAAGLPGPPGDGDGELSAESLVAELVERKFFNPASPDPVLEIPQHTFGRALDLRAVDALNCYRRVIASERVPVEPEGRRAAQDMLRLAGMVKLDAAATAKVTSLSGATVRSGLQAQEASLSTRNAIFARRYGAAWVRDRLDSPMYATLATHWKLQARDPAFLLRGRSLGAAQDWLAAQGEVSKDVAEFIQASAQTEVLDHGISHRSRSRRLLLLIASLLAMAAIAVTALLLRAEQQGAAEQAARQSLQATLAVAQATQTSLERQLSSYKSQTADALAQQTLLQGKLDQANTALAAVNNEKQAVQAEYDTARKRHASNLAEIRAKLDDVNHRADTLTTEQTRLLSDLQTEKNREATLQADLQAAQAKANGLAADIQQSKAMLSQEKQVSAGLASQIEALKTKLSDLTGQLNDVQTKYNDCVARLSEANRALENARSQVTSCETRPKQ